jgi:hypothetical protein
MTVFAIQYFLLIALGAILFWRVPVSQCAGSGLNGAEPMDALSSYRRPMLLSYQIEILAAVGALATRSVWLFMTACVLLSAAMTWHRVGLAARVLPSSPLRAVAASLEYRGRHANPTAPLEVILAIATVTSVLLMAPDARNLTAKSLAIPGRILYLYLGLLLARRAAVQARLLPIPAERAPEYFELREGARQLILLAVDWLRTLAACLMLCWALVATRVFDIAWSTQVLAIPFWILYLMAMVDMSPRLWKFLVMRGSLNPRSASIDINESVRAPFHWNSDSPAMMLRGVHGWALNLADRRTQMWAAYTAGLFALIWMGVIR